MRRFQERLVLVLVALDAGFRTDVLDSRLGVKRWVGRQRQLHEADQDGHGEESGNQTRGHQAKAGHDFWTRDDVRDPIRVGKSLGFQASSRGCDGILGKTVRVRSLKLISRCRDSVALNFGCIAFRGSGTRGEFRSVLQISESLDDFQAAAKSHRNFPCQSSPACSYCQNTFVVDRCGRALPLVDGSGAAVCGEGFGGTVTGLDFTVGATGWAACGAT